MYAQRSNSVSFTLFCVFMSEKNTLRVAATDFVIFQLKCIYLDKSVTSDDGNFRLISIFGDFSRL